MLRIWSAGQLKVAEKRSIECQADLLYLAHSFQQCKQALQDLMKPSWEIRAYTTAQQY